MICQLPYPRDTYTVLVIVKWYLGTSVMSGIIYI